jgi:hypothetical protein
MATQGATLERRGMHVPIWLIAALVALAMAIAVVGSLVIDDVRPAQPAASIRETESSGDGTGPRGATAEAVRDARALGAWSARIHDLPAGPFHEAGRAHEVEVSTRGLPR